MKRFSRRCGLWCTGVLALVGLVGGTASARADGYAPCYHYEEVTAYQTVTVYETRQEPYTKVVTLYDHCGYPYQATRTYYRTVKVPVTKKVPVKKMVKVYD
jgi:hypothetical protein